MCTVALADQFQPKIWINFGLNQCKSVQNLIIFYVFFAENDIDEAVFKLLTSKEINEMIKSVGLRVKFENEHYKIFPQ